MKRHPIAQVVMADSGLSSYGITDVGLYKTVLSLMVLSYMFGLHTAASVIHYKFSHD